MDHQRAHPSEMPPHERCNPGALCATGKCLKGTGSLLPGNCPLLTALGVLRILHILAFPVLLACYLPESCEPLSSLREAMFQFGGSGYTTECEPVSVTLENRIARGTEKPQTPVPGKRHTVACYGTLWHAMACQICTLPPPPVFFSQLWLAHNHTPSLSYCLWLLPMGGLTGQFQEAPEAGSLA